MIKGTEDLDVILHRQIKYTFLTKHLLFFISLKQKQI